MAVKFIAIKCPECGTSLDIEEDRKTMYCSYCGHKIMMVDENEHRYTVTHHYVDDAKIREVDRKAEIKKEQNKINKDKFDKIVELISIIAMSVVMLLIVMFLFFLMFLDSQQK